MQRLFSTFPDGSPGTGLLSLRLGGGIALIHLAIVHPSAAPLVAAAAAIPLLAGLWTPIIGAVIALTEIWIAFYQPGDPWFHTLLAFLGAGLALLGPGAWSVDARLFGRKLFLHRNGNGGGTTPPKSGAGPHADPGKKPDSM